MDAETLNREERRSIRLHRAVARRLLASPDAVVARARQNLAVMRRANDDGSADGWLDEWERLLDGAVIDVAAVLVSTDERARDLRQVTPFSGVLTPRERWALCRSMPSEAGCDGTSSST